MSRPFQILWVLSKTAIFTALAPYTVGLVLPGYIHRAYTPPADILPGPAWSTFASPFLLVSGVAIYLWCAWDFGVKGMGTPAPIDAPKKLVINGLYRFVRNPMYLGVFCLIISQAMSWYSKPILAYLIFVSACFHLFIIFYEEPHLRGVFGPQYEDYCRNVGRWIPRLTPYHPTTT